MKKSKLYDDLFVKPTMHSSEIPLSKTQIKKGMSRQTEVSETPQCADHPTVVLASSDDS